MCNFEIRTDQPTNPNRLTHRRTNIQSKSQGSYTSKTKNEKFIFYKIVIYQEHEIFLSSLYDSQSQCRNNNSMLSNNIGHHLEAQNTKFFQPIADMT